MPFVELKKLIELQNEISKVRNICILAHVDHGKTTLADSLVASNGIISQRMAGKLRYLDNRPDEQERGITMKSSSISLYYQNFPNSDEYLINLIDSPGHIDFCNEVSTAVRLCDGAIIIVDVLEGVCPQTRACLQQVYTEKLKPVLLLNKIDRLILEKQMSPLDAYVHITQVLEQVNAAFGNIFASDILSKEQTTLDKNYVSALDEVDDSKLYFSPENKNVVFCSALDGWAFTIDDFAKMYSQRLNIEPKELEKALWGDYFYNAKKKCSVLGAQEKAKKPMFVQFIFENLWNLYDIIIIRKDKEKLPGVAEKLGVKLQARDLRLTEPRAQLKILFQQWLPIDTSVLKIVVDNIPSPKCIDEERSEQLLCSSSYDFKSFPIQTQELKKHFVNCNPKSETVIAFISKMVAVEKSKLPENKPKRLTQEELDKRREIARQKILERKQQQATQENADLQSIEKGIETLATDDSKNNTEVESQKETLDDKNDHVFIAFARVFSGTIKKGMKLFALSPKHNPKILEENAEQIDFPYVEQIVVGDLYLFMGGDLESLEEVPAGNIIGIGGLENAVVKSATLSSSIYCPSFSEMNQMAKPILRVAIEPVNPLEMPKLLKGLKLLNQSDACVQVSLQETGEHVIATLGEVHLEKCVRDLEESYAKIKLNVSKPIVSFRETIVPEATVDMVNEMILKTEKEDISKKIINIQTANKSCSIAMLALPMPQKVTEILEANVDIFKILLAVTKFNTLSDKQILIINQVKNSLQTALIDFKINLPHDKSNLVNKIWSVGPKKIGTNILLNLSDYIHSNFWNPSISISKSNQEDVRKDFDYSFINGFQLATAAGPLCEEPMTGVCFLILDWKIDPETDFNSKTFGPFSGQIMSAVKEGCKKAFQFQPQRLVTPMYSCNIVVNADVQGK
ncbi:elongation factor-like GTPase 1 isoform X2 [Condylostylus longicornis]|nr:elongation factor-like GTPase 1 isoform X2 [Condylostylus longicornis]